MNIFRPQRPYFFRPPKYSSLLAPFLIKISEVFFLRRTFRMRRITSEGLDSVSQLVDAGHTVLIAPNHADHADPHVLICLGRRHGLTFHFMAAREGFELSRLHAFALQRCGAFSVDREGADIASIKTAMQILRQGRFPLVVFPEGEIYHHQEQLDPLNEGVSTMLLRAAKSLPIEKCAYLIPAAMLYTYEEAVKCSFSERLSVLEERITWKPRDDLEVVDRIYRLGEGLLALKEVEFLGSARPGSLIDRLSNLRNELVAAVEEKHLRKKGTGSIPERVKALRARIRKQLLGSDGNISEEEQARLYDDLDTLFVAVQLYSYPGQYLRENYSVDRIAETILKLEEDVLGKADYPAHRDVHVKFGAPIEVKTYLKEHSFNTRNAVGPLTTLLSERIQSMLQELG